jgi:hypothetical protein
MECFTQAWRFLDRNWRLLLPAAAITAALSQIGLVLVMLLRPAPAAGETMLAAMLWDLVAVAPAMVASLMFTAAILRKALRDEFIGPTGLAFGADEIRLLGVMAALACMLLPLVGLLFLAVSTFVFGRIASTPEALNALLADPEALNAALEAALGPTGVLAFLLFFILVMSIFLYVSTRLVMVNAATMGERRVVIFQTWIWSRGNVWRILGAVILTALPVMFFQGLIDSLGVEIINATPEGASLVATRLIINSVSTFLFAIAGIPSIALAAILYKGLRPGDFVAK